jgi:hypothetical protein
MKYKFRSGTGMLAMLLLSLCACRKENKTESPAPAPLPQLATSNYSDDFGTISNLFEFQYDAGDKRTKQVRNRWRTVNQTGDYSYRFNYTGQLGIRKEYDINNAEVPGSLRSYTFNDKGRAASCAFFDRFIQKNVLYQYEYNTAGFLNKTSVYYEGVLKYSREYYYNAASRLDSTAAFIHLANSRPKFLNTKPAAAIPLATTRCLAPLPLHISTMQVFLALRSRWRLQKKRYGATEGRACTKAKNTVLPMSLTVTDAW